MQRLIYARGAPIARIGGCQFQICGMAPLPPVDVEMHGPFQQNDRKDKSEGRTNKDKGEQRSDGMDACVQEATKVQVLPASIEHHPRLKEVVRQHVFNL